MPAGPQGRDTEAEPPHPLLWCMMAQAGWWRGGQQPCEGLSSQVVGAKGQHWGACATGLRKSPRLTLQGQGWGHPGRRGSVQDGAGGAGRSTEAQFSTGLGEAGPRRDPEATKSDTHGSTET